MPRLAPLCLAILLFVLVFMAGRRAVLLLALFLNIVVLTHLALVSLRRLIFTCLALQPAATNDESPPEPPPHLTVLVPCRDEGAVLPETLAAWDEIDYPRERLELMLIDDAGDGATAALLDEFAENRTWVTVLHRPGPAVGKGAALQAGLTAARDAEAAAVFDADAVPDPSCLRLLAARLADPQIAAVAGRMFPRPDPSPAAVYAALEAAVHQRVTLTGAARCGAVTPLLGSAYLVRRPLLDRLGFAPEQRLEDIDLSLRLLAAGYRIAWEPRAFCSHRPPADAVAFRRQRIAWARGFHRLLGRYGRALVWRAPSPLLAVERLLFSTAYLDRLSLSLAVLLAALAPILEPAVWMPWWVPAAAAVLTVLQIVPAVWLDRWPRARRRRILPALALAPLDLLAEWLAVGADILRRPQRWEKIPRAGEDRSP